MLLRHLCVSHPFSNINHRFFQPTSLRLLNFKTMPATSVDVCVMVTRRENELWPLSFATTSSRDEARDEVRGEEEKEAVREGGNP